MNIIHVNNIDLTGARFNGHDMQVSLNKQGISCKQFVIEKLGDNPNTISLVRDNEEPFLRNICKIAESDLSIHSMLYPYGWRLMEHHDFQQADIVHYHLLHNYMISYAMFPELAKTKPSVLTIHDPWLFTGHCIYPMDCTKWEHEQCEACPHLNRHFPLKEDMASYLWRLKKEIFSCMDIDIVVASQWMLDLARRSPITAHIKDVHLIPFGIDTDLFCDTRDKDVTRAKLGIPSSHVVLFFRSDPSEYKGASYIQEMLDCLAPSHPITLLTVGMIGLIKKGNHEIVEMGWVNDDEQMADLYGASDIFLMPSVAEAFGLMAIEAMSSGLPIVVFSGTSLPSVTCAPECGIVIENKDANQFARVVERLINNEQERNVRGKLGRTLALKHYRSEDHFRKLLELYGDILSRKN